VVQPPDAPHFGAKGRSKHDPATLTALFFISLLSTADITLTQYPKIAIDVPRDIAAKHRDDTLALALYDPGQKDSAYRLAVADRDLSSPLPGSMPSPNATPFPTPVPTPYGPQGMAPGGVLTPPPVGTGLNSAALPPEYVAFQATPATLRLVANRPVVFALYAVPAPPSPTPSASASPNSSPKSAASATASPPATSSTASAVPSSTP
jgi:hypothetical protein